MALHRRVDGPRRAKGRASRATKRKQKSATTAGVIPPSRIAIVYTVLAPRDATTASPSRPAARRGRLGWSTAAHSAAMAARAVQTNR